MKTNDSIELHVAHMGGLVLLSLCFFAVFSMADVVLLDGGVRPTRPRIGVPISATVTGEVDNAASNLTWTWYSWKHNGAEKMAIGESSDFTPTTNQYERWVQAVASNEEGRVAESEPFWFSKLPVLYISIDGNRTPSAAKEELAGSLFAQGNAAWDSPYDGRIEKIHVRGNSSSSWPKKPYKIKLAKKADLFGMGEQKHWVLFSNWNDPSLQRNKLCMDLSAQMGLVAMESEWVDVVLNSKFIGCYTLSEHIRIDEKRVDVYNWEDAAEKVAEKFAEKFELNAEEEVALGNGLTKNLSWVTDDSVTFKDHTAKPSEIWKKFTNDISGGYLFELDHRGGDVTTWTCSAGNLPRVVINALNPEYLRTNTAMFDYVKTRWRDYFTAIQSDNLYDGKGHYSGELADVESMAAYWLVMNVTHNGDAVQGSRYAYWDRGGRIKFGPAWDFDGALGHWASRWILSKDTSGVVTGITHNESSTEISPPHGVYNGNFFGAWCADPYFMMKCYECYNSISNYLNEIVRDGGIIDRQTEYLYEAGVANSEIWPVQNYIVFQGENGDVAYLKSFARSRFKWFAGKMVSVRNILTSCRATSQLNMYTDTPEKLQMSFGTGTLPNAASVEGATPNIFLAEGGDLDVSVAVAERDIVSVESYANGISNSVSAVVNGTANFTVPANRFIAENGLYDMVSLIGRTALGTRKRMTYALVKKRVATDVPLAVSSPLVEVRHSATNTVYQGAPICPEVEVRIGETVLEKGIDYSVSYVGNDQVGLAKVVIQGLGDESVGRVTGKNANLVGTHEIEFRIGRDARHLALWDLLEGTATTIAGPGGDDVYTIVLDADMVGPLQIADDLGAIRLDCNGHSIFGADGTSRAWLPGGNGRAAIEFVHGEGTDCTSLTVMDSGIADDAPELKGGDGGNGTPPGSGSTAITFAEGVDPVSILLEFADGVDVVSGADGVLDDNPVGLQGIDLGAVTPLRITCINVENGAVVLGVGVSLLEDIGFDGWLTGTIALVNSKLKFRLAGSLGDLRGPAAETVVVLPEYEVDRDSGSSTATFRIPVAVSKERLFIQAVIEW